MGSRFSLAAATAVMLFCAVASAQMKPEAQARLDSGLAHFAAKEWDAAIADFSAGYAIDPRPELLYAWAQAERLGGDCAAAVPLYQKYIASGVTAEQAKITADHLAACQAAVAAAPPATPRRREPWTRDFLGHALVGAGALSLAGGAIFFASSSSEADAAPGAASYPEYADHIDAARSRRALAWVGLGAGAALVTAGLLHYALRDAPEVTAWLDGGGGGLGLAGSF